MPRSPFRTPDEKTSEILERIHSDLCGPWISSKGKSRYNLIFLDDYSHYVFIFTIPNKSSATLRINFAKFIKLVENQTNKRMKKPRTDNGGEYEGELTPFLESLGIKHEPTAPYTPQSNRKAERMNRTLNESVRAMLFHANMPDNFWAEAMATAAHVWNLLPSNLIVLVLENSMTSGADHSESVQHRNTQRTIGSRSWDGVDLAGSFAGNRLKKFFSRAELDRDRGGHRAVIRVVNDLEDEEERPGRVEEDKEEEEDLYGNLGGDVDHRTSGTDTVN